MSEYKSILDSLVLVHNDYVAHLEVEKKKGVKVHDSDMKDWCDAIHNLQRILSKRELESINPEFFK